MSREHKINTGYDLALRLFEKHKDNLDCMIGLTGGRETPWLEFKADPFCRSHEGGEKQEDYSWHILKAIIAFANTCGGAIIIGADDNGKSVPLRDKDSGEYTENLDKYRRDLDAVLFSRNQFTVRSENDKNPNRVKIEFDNKRCRSLVDVVESGKLEGKTVVVLLVREAEPADEFLFCKKDGDEILLVRDLKVGKNQLLTFSEAMKYIKNRPEIQPLREYYSSIPNPNDCFVGREKELKDLHRLLSEIPPRIPLIHGPGGTGKTELAFRYAETFGDKYEACIYLRAENISSIPEGFGQMLLDPQLVAKYRLEIPENVIRLEDRFRIIRDNLLKYSKGDILILFDNLENPGVLNPSEIRKYLMVRDWEKLHLYATTRLNNLQVAEYDTIYPFPLTGLPESDALALLKKKRPFDNAEEETAARALVEYLDGNAWALDFIGEDLKQRHPKYDNDYREWLEVIKKEPLKAFSEAAEQETVRIKHGCLDPVKLLEPTLNRLDPVARSFANTAALCNPDFIYTGWLKGVYLRKTRKKEIPVRQFDKAIAKLKDSHVFSQRTEEDKSRGVIHSGEQETFEVIKLHRLTRSVLRSLLGDDLKKELLVFRKYFLRELLNVLHAGDQEYQGIGDAMPKFGAGTGGFAGCCIGSFNGLAASIVSSFARNKETNFAESSSSPSPLSSITFSGSSALLSKAIGLGVFETGDKEKKRNAIGSWAKVAGVVTGAVAGMGTGAVAGMGTGASATALAATGKIVATGAAFGGLPGLLLGTGAAALGLLYLKKNSEKNKEPQDKPLSMPSDNLEDYLGEVVDDISPSPDWMNTVLLFLFSFEEIRNDLDADDIQCVRVFLNICSNKLSDLRIFSGLHDRKMEAVGVELLFRLYPIVTETLKEAETEEEYLTTAAVLYNNLVNYWQLAKDQPEEQKRLEFCLQLFIVQAKEWQEKHQRKLDRKLEGIGPSAGRKFKPLSKVRFPGPVFCEKI